MSELSIPALTTIRQPKYEAGLQSAQLLIQKIRGESEQIVHKVLETTVVLRDTVGPCPIQR